MPSNSLWEQPPGVRTRELQSVTQQIISIWLHLYVLIDYMNFYLVKTFIRAVCSWVLFCLVGQAAPQLLHFVLVE